MIGDLIYKGQYLNTYNTYIYIYKHDQSFETNMGLSDILENPTLTVDHQFP